MDIGAIRLVISPAAAVHGLPVVVKGLEAAAAEDLVGVTVEGVGSTLHFPKLDADFTVSRLLEGFLGPMDWTRREARALASPENG